MKMASVYLTTVTGLLVVVTSASLVSVLGTLEWKKRNIADIAQDKQATLLDNAENQGQAQTDHKEAASQYAFSYKHQKRSTSTACSNDS